MPATSGVVLQPRDFALFTGLFESRMMTVRHVAAIHFNGHREMAKKRVQRLRAKGYLSQYKRSPQEPALLTLSKKGLTTLHTHGALRSYPQMARTAFEKRMAVSKATLQHEIDVLDVQIAITAAVADINARVAEFRTRPELFQFKARPNGSYGAPEVLVKPDGYLRIIEKKDGSTFEHTFFLEVDRSTETQDTLAAKGASYVAYYKAGSYAEWLGHPCRNGCHLPRTISCDQRNVTKFPQLSLKVVAI